MSTGDSRRHWTLLQVGAAVLVILSLQSGSAFAYGKDVMRLEGWDLAVHDSLNRPVGDPTACFSVRGGSVWTTSVGSYRFESGTLTFLATVGGRPTGAHFAGRATIDFMPPSAIERGQLRRFCGDTALSRTLDEMYLCFYDWGTYGDLLGCCDSTPSVRVARSGDLRGWQDRLNDDVGMYMPAHGWLSLSRPEMPRSFLIVSTRIQGTDPLHFVVNDAFEEAVTLLKRPQTLVGKAQLDLVCSYDRERSAVEEEYRQALLGRALVISRYDSDVTIRNSAEMALDVSMRMVAKRDGLRDIAMILAPELDLDSVWVDDAPAPFIYRKDYGELSIRAGQPIGIGDTVIVRVAYSGKNLLYKFTWGDFFVSYTTSWLPIVNPLDRAEYRTTFRFPKHYDLVSSGELIGDSIDGDIRVKSWETYEPASFISFNYGSFDVLSTRMLEGPRLDVYRSRNHTQGLFGGDVKKAVAGDIEGSIQLFTRMFGPYPWPHLAATEIPGMHGQGFPQLLHLAWYSFETSKQGITDAFRAHEVAHQWFGHLVGWKTYHDQWLSEGFAEYAGAMYVQARNPGNKAFLKLVKDWRSNILDVGGMAGWHAGPHVAPIWLGVRCASASSPDSYYNLVYSKGAYVLHMLRNMLHDFRSGSDDKFAELMRDFVSTYAHREASTEDFQNVVEKHMGRDMQWFFDQWVYGTQIPRYEYSWSREKTEDGAWIVRGRIDQYDVDSNFRVFMPVTIEFDDGDRTYLHDVIGSGLEFNSPKFAEKPKNVRFNDYLTILCKEKTIRKP